MVIHLAILGTGIYLGKRTIEKTYTTFEACHYGMQELFNNNPTKGLFHKDVLAAVKDHKFEVGPITLVKVIDEFNCDVVAKDAKGLRSFKVTLEKSSNFAHFYRVLDVKGQKLESPYQWRASL